MRWVSVARWCGVGSGSVELLEVDATQMQQSRVGARTRVDCALRYVAEPGEAWVARSSFT
jgi:hypothetical protein